ncbi:flagellar assembly protein FliW [Acidithiobacillus sp.]|uniref:flagellar assembly protein FliW n=1 Tax=Acidithiobacillus sp. TaxID=1872118 RepID=UPI0026311557|nr:flagellar assembly protein FliW [Acidithiobacillus sp.]MDD2748503.1 flagellar assembly protein FliW [Acidithiobacillus sp.]MDD5278262.1 flagellar assembly protein FliW [Acidithiobacillus sp.]
MKTYDTRFGPFSIADEEIWHCIAPMPGFTNLQRFALLHLPSQGPFVWLQSLDEALITFLLVAPKHFNLHYSQAPYFAKTSGVPMLMVILPQTENGMLQSNSLAPLYFLPETRQFGQWIVERHEMPPESLSASHLPPAKLQAHIVIPVQETDILKTEEDQSLATGTA